MDNQTQIRSTNQNAGGKRTPAAASAAALNPLVPALTQPTKSLVEKGHIQMLSAVWTPMGCSVHGRAGPALIAKGIDGNVNQPVGVLIEAARSAGLIGKNAKSGVSAEGANSLPKKSLCDRDFGVEALPRLQQRCNAVAEASGGGALVGRVRSAGRFAGEVTTSYVEWWSTASPEDRLLSVTDARNRGKIPAESVAAMANLNCPFRNNLEFVVAAEEEGEEESGGAPVSPS
jgi:hypothetical protein